MKGKIYLLLMLAGFIFLGITYSDLVKTNFRFSPSSGYNLFIAIFTFFLAYKAYKKKQLDVDEDSSNTI